MTECKLYYGAAGQVLSIRFSGCFGWGLPAPAGAAGTFLFDADANAATVTDLEANPAAYAVSGGQLRKNGVPVSLAQGGEYAERRAVRDDYQTALTWLNQIQTESLSGLTLAQTQGRVETALRRLALIQERTLKLVKRHLAD